MKHFFKDDVVKFVFNINESKTYNINKFWMQVELAIDRINDNYGYSYLIGTKIGFNGDDFYRNKLTLVITFSNLQTKSPNHI